MATSSSDPQAETKSVYAKEVHFDNYILGHGDYEYVKINPKSGLTTATCNTTSNADLYFNFPGTVYNSGMSYMEGTIKIPGTNADNVYNYFFCEGIPFIQGLYFYETGTSNIVQIDDFNKYLKGILRRNIKLEDFLTYDVVSTSDSSAGQRTYFEGLTRVNQFALGFGAVAHTDAAAPGTALANPLTTANTNTVLGELRTNVNTALAALATSTNNALAASNNNFRPVGGLDAANAATSYAGRGPSSSKSSLIEPGYYIKASQAGSNGNAAQGQMNIKFKFNFSLFINTVLGLNKDFYYGPRGMELKIVLARSNDIYFTAINAQFAAGQSNATPVKTVSLSDLTVHLAVEKNRVMADKLINEYNAGSLSYVFPYVHVKRHNLPITAVDTSTHTIEETFGADKGQKLLKIYWVPFWGTQVGHRTYNHCNVYNQALTANLKVQEFNTSLDSRPIYSNFPYSCANGDDYRAQKRRLKGSCLFSADEYYHNWSWCEDFTNNYSMTEKPLTPDESSYIDGIDITADKKYTISAKVSGTGDAGNNQGQSITHYVFAITLRKMSVSPSGMMIV